MATRQSGAERARRENRVVAEMSALAGSNLEYGDVIAATLDLVEQVVSSPYLGLSMQVDGHVEQYARVGGDVDAMWIEEVGAYIADIQRERLTRNGSSSHGGITDHLASPATWVMSFPARARSGRSCALTLACPRPLSVKPDEEQLMLRLARHVLLVVDYALTLQQLENVEVVDALTGVANQRRLLDLLEYEMRRHRHYGRWLAIVVLDVEGLDRINRSYGRHYGNHILQKLAALLQGAVRPIDIVARYGLDEFAVVLPETDGEQGSELAEKLQETLLEVEFAGGNVRLSVGVAHVGPDEVLPAESFLRRGERALQEAKRQERGWNALWQPSARRTLQ